MRAQKPETKALRRLISESGMTQKEIGKAIELSEHQISNLLNERTKLEVATLRRILNVLGVSLAEYEQHVEHHAAVDSSPPPLEVDALQQSEAILTTLHEAVERTNRLRYSLEQQAKK